jgi:hypothetical protein
MTVAHSFLFKSAQLPRDARKRARMVGFLAVVLMVVKPPHRASVRVSRS